MLGLPLSWCSRVSPSSAALPLGPSIRLRSLAWGETRAKPRFVARRLKLDQDMPLSLVIVSIPPLAGKALHAPRARLGVVPGELAGAVPTDLACRHHKPDIGRVPANLDPLNRARQARGRAASQGRGWPRLEDRAQGRRQAREINGPSATAARRRCPTGRCRPAST